MNLAPVAGKAVDRSAAIPIPEGSNMNFGARLPGGDSVKSGPCKVSSLPTAW